MTLEQNRIICPWIHLIRGHFPAIRAEKSRGEGKKKSKAAFKIKCHFKKGNFIRWQQQGWGKG